MKAFIKKRYGGPEVLRLEDVEMPALQDDHITVNVHANSANPADWHILRGTPFIARFAFGLFSPKQKIAGADFAGVVSAVGNNVKSFKIGDRVFGETLMGGAFAEYTSVPANVCALMPGHSSFAEMACVPIAGVTALQAMITHGKLEAGQSVLINGSSGGVGHFAVQIAKAYGAEVTGVCSSRNVDFVQSLGADHVLAYDSNDIHRHNGKYDLVVDTHGNLSFQDYKRMGRRGVLVGLTTMGHTGGVLLQKAFSSYPLVQFTAEANTRDLQTLAELIQKKKVTVHIEQIFPAIKIPNAIGYIEKMRTRGKIAMVWDHPQPNAG